MRKTGPIIFLLLLAGAGAFFLSTFDKERVSYFWDNPERIEKEDITVLILGRVAEGQGGRWHSAPGLTDAIVIVNYRPTANVINLVSLPRDLYGEFGGDEFKVNEIYRRKKIEGFMEKLPEIIGIEVENFLVVDVDLIETAVDRLGGIDVELTAPVTDSVSGFRLEAGTHRLSGEDAIWLMRNRYSPEGDFFREKNQHVVIASIFNHINMLSAVKRTAFLLGMVPYVRDAETNFSIGEIVPRFGEINDPTFNSVTLDFSTGLLRSSYVPVGVRFADIVTSTPQFNLGQATTSVTSTPQGASGQATATLTIPTSPTTPTIVNAYVLIPTEGINNYTAIREFIESKLK